MYIQEFSVHFLNTLCTHLNYLNVLWADLCSIHQQDLYIPLFQNYRRFHSCTSLFLDLSSTFWQHRWAEFLQREIGQETMTSMKILKKLIKWPNNTMIDLLIKKEFQEKKIYRNNSSPYWITWIYIYEYTWHVVIWGLVVTVRFGEPDVYQDNVCEDTTVRFIAHRDIGTHHVFFHPSQVVNDVTSKTHKQQPWEKLLK